MRMKRRAAGIVVAAGFLLVQAGLEAPAGAQDVGCATEASGGGSWPSDTGANLLGTRSQPAEDTIGPGNVGSLEQKWSFPIPENWGGTATMPIVAEGCVYMQTSWGTSGDTIYQIVALNADTGQLVWNYPLGASGAMAAPHVHEGVVYVNHPTTYDEESGTKGPHVLALDSQTGDLIYAGETVCTEPACANNAGATSPAMYFDGLVWIGITNPELDSSQPKIGGYAIVDATDGSLIKRVHIVPEEETRFGGCSIWTSPALDPETGYGFVGTAQPSPWAEDTEDGRCNAIIKFDMARARDGDGSPVLGGDAITNPDFGEIVAHRKGTVDSPIFLDVDFGGSAATLLNDSSGRQIVTHMQKSGYLHAAYTDDMSPAWSAATPGWGTAIGPFTKTASDCASVFTVGWAGFPITSIAGDDGLYNWISPTFAPSAQGSVAYANGVVYFTDQLGILYGYDSMLGVPLFAEPIPGCPRPTLDSPYGTSVARHTVYSACGSVVAAYGLP